MGEKEGGREGGGKGAAPPIGCLSTKSGAGLERRGRGWAGGCWGAEVGARAARRAPPPPAAILWQCLPSCQGWAVGPEVRPALPGPAGR